MQPELSVVVCVYNEEDNVRLLVERISEALVNYEYEIVYVDDGSTDATLANLKAIQHNGLRIIEFRKNYGQSLALMAGIDYAKGKYIVTMDGDLQNDPRDIPEMLRILKEGEYDMIVGNRVNRKDGALLRKLPSQIANSIIRSSSGVRLKDYGCALKVFTNELAQDLGIYGELHRFITLLAVLEGAKVTQVDVKHHARQFGKSKYGLGRTFKVMSDLLLMLFFKKYMQRPMHLFGNIGVMAFLIGLLINAYFGVLKLMGQDIWGRPLLILGFLLVIAGIQFITIGIVIELQMRTYYESQQKRPYKVRNVIENEKVESMS
ncbi:MAG: glycosyltransferase family 2 protein [Bacteroidota bacterium]